MSSHSVEKFEVPAWDVALEALAREEQQKCGRPLQIADFRRLASAHAIRFDDIMATLFELVIHRVWDYRPCAGCNQTIDREVVDNLYVNRRLKEEDVMAFAGDWSVAQDRAR